MYKFVLLGLVMVLTTLVVIGTSARSGTMASVLNRSKGTAIAQIYRSESEIAESDSLDLPPVQQTFASGDYQLVVEALDEEQTAQGQIDQGQTEQWQTEQAIAKLYRNDALQWQQALPHAYGPRFVVLTAEGQTLLLDEFINVASPYAITLLDVAGQPVAQYSFEEVRAAIAQPAAVLTQQATSGWWITSIRELSPAEASVQIQTGGQTLTIDLHTGELSVN